MYVVGVGNNDDPSRKRRERTQVLHGCRQLVSWDVRLSPGTSATPTVSCQQVMLGTLMELPVNSRRKEGMTSSQYGPYVQGDTRATMGGTKGRNTARWSQSIKAILSSDWGLQLAPMKLESLVIVGQPHHGEYVLGACTHRPSHQPSGGRSKSSRFRGA